MNREKVIKEALSSMPKISTKTVDNIFRHEIVNYLHGTENVGIELGVATGKLSKKFLDSGKFRVVFGVDVYGDTHDSAEYKKALSTIGLESNHKLIRLSFDDAIELFPDGYFDFIYVDGFAHTGEEGGKVLSDWYPKLKVGGVMSGDDYHQDWPLVMWAVNHFSSQIGCRINLTGKVQNEEYSQYPSWFFVKEQDFSSERLLLDKRLVTIATKEKRRINFFRKYKKLKRDWAKKLRSVLKSGLSD